MASDPNPPHYRPPLPPQRTSSPVVPTAPPLPPTRYLDAAKTFIAAPFRYGPKPPREPRPPTTASRSDGPPSGGVISGVGRGHHHSQYGASTSLRSSYSQTSSFHLDARINALDCNESRTHAILAGRRILQTVAIQDGHCNADYDLRIAAVEHATRSMSRHDRASLDSLQRETQLIEDVSWSTKAYASCIATAGANGKVILWDLNRPDLQLARLHEHQRQVHAVAFNRFEGALLLSASQDATVRLWDLRTLRREIMVCPSRSVMSSQTDGVHALKWSPTDATAFAIGTESGAVQRWELRHNAKPQLKIAAHDQPCTSLDWHPDGRHLVTGSRDRRAKVWDLASTFKRQKAKYYLRTPHSIRRVAWRPPCDVSAQADQQAVWQAAQLAISYDGHPAVHIWDWRRENIPHRELFSVSGGDNGPTDMLWHSRDLLWTVGHGDSPAGNYGTVSATAFTQTDIPFVSKLLERRNLQSFAAAPNGDCVSFAQPRRLDRRAQLDADDYDSEREENAAEYYNDTRDPEHMSHGQHAPIRETISRSPADDSIDDNFLFNSGNYAEIDQAASTSRRRRTSRTTATASASAASRLSLSRSATPPPSLQQAGSNSLDEDLQNQILRLDQIIKQYDSSRPQQWSHVGRFPGGQRTSEYRYLAQKLKTTSLQATGDTPVSVTDLLKAFVQNSGYAQAASLYRDAQTWKIFGLLLSRDLLDRARINRMHRAIREASKQSIKSAVKPSLTETAPVILPARINAPIRPEITTFATTGNAVGGAFSLAPPPSATLTAKTETSSNAATPLARPFAEGDNIGLRHAAVPHINEDLLLPPSLASSDRDTSNASDSATTNVTTDARHAALKTTIDRPTSPPYANVSHVLGSPGRYESATDRDARLAQVSNWRAPPKTPLNLSSVTPSNDDSDQGTELDLERKHSADSFMLFSASTDSHAALSKSNSFLSTGSRSSKETRFQSHTFDGPDINLSPDRDTPGESPTLAKSSYPFSSDAGSKGTVDEGTNMSRASAPRLPRSDSARPSITFASTTYNSSQSSQMGSYPAVGLPASRLVKPTHGHDDLGSSASAYDPVGQSVEASAPLPKPKEDPLDYEQVPFVAADFISMLDSPVQGASLSKPFTSTDALLQLLQWYATRGNSQMATHLFLCWRIFLPPFDPQAHLHDQTAPSPGLSDSASPYTKYIKSIESDLLAANLSPLWLESILSTYHASLTEQGLHNPATRLRRLAYPIFPAVYEQSLHDVEVGTLCTACRNPINNAQGRLRCETCKQRQASCSICWLERSPFQLGAKVKMKIKPKLDSTLVPHHSPSPASSPSLWTSCLTCSHSTHAACLDTWLTDSSSGGTCPVAGCICDCARGHFRDERLAGGRPHVTQSLHAHTAPRGSTGTINPSPHPSYTAASGLPSRRTRSMNAGTSIPASATSAVTAAAASGLVQSHGYGATPLAHASSEFSTSSTVASTSIGTNMSMSIDDTSEASVVSVSAAGITPASISTGTAIGVNAHHGHSNSNSNGHRTSTSALPSPEHEGSPSPSSASSSLLAAQSFAQALSTSQPRLSPSRLAIVESSSAEAVPVPVPAGAVAVAVQGQGQFGTTPSSLPSSFALSRTPPRTSLDPAAAAAAAVARQPLSPVRHDDWSVDESRAVGRAVHDLQRDRERQRLQALARVREGNGRGS